MFDLQGLHTLNNWLSCASACCWNVTSNNCIQVMLWTNHMPHGTKTWTIKQELKHKKLVNTKGGNVHWVSNSTPIYCKVTLSLPDVYRHAKVHEIIYTHREQTMLIIQSYCLTQVLKYVWILYLMKLWPSGIELFEGMIQDNKMSSRLTMLHYRCKNWY